VELSIENFSESAQELDLIAVQDAGLKVRQPGPVNEYYVSQYIERLVWKDKRYGQVICVRQNMKEAGGHPWLMMACTEGAEAASVDGMQFFGPVFAKQEFLKVCWQKNLAGSMPVNHQFWLCKVKNSDLTQAKFSKRHLSQLFCPITLKLLQKLTWRN
jgi:hypothetical protein